MEQKQNRPMTGTEYLESLQDGREVWIYGEKVKNVTEHPAFRNSSRMIARLYDALHDPEKKEILTSETDTGTSGYTHKFFRTPHNAQDLIEGRDAIAEWARMTYGWLGRSPDYKAAFLGTLGANSDFYAPYQENALNWYKKAQEQVLFFNHTIVDPPVDRNRSIEDVKDVFVHVTKETDSGIYVSGAKVVATGSALTHYNFVSHAGIPLKQEEFAVIFITAMNTPGVKIFCRTSYEMAAQVMGSPFDYPLSSRMDENDAIFVFDNVFIPWENVLMYRDVDKANRFLSDSGFLPRLTLHGCTRLAVKLDFISGLLLKALDATGTIKFRGVQVNVGEVLAWRHLFWSLSEAMVRNPTSWENGSVLPNMESALAYRAISPTVYTKIKEIIENVVASGLIYLNSHAVDFKEPEIRKHLEKYLRGTGEYDWQERVKLMKLLWDCIGTEFGSRHELYEKNYAGNHEDIRLGIYDDANETGQNDTLKKFAETCLSEYDLDGWKSPDLINPNDINLFLNKFR